MEKFLNSRGSVWSKWDLHIHTPSSVLNSEFKGDWDRYFKVLENLEDFSVLGITDYFSIDGYKKVKKYKDEGNLQNIDLVLPNVEMRLNTTTTKGRAINIHVIFSPEVDHLIEKYFLEELDFEYKGSYYKCNETDLRGLGELFLDSDNYSPEKALFEGMKQFKISLDKLKAVFQKHQARFKDKYLIILPNSNVDGNSGNKDDAFKAVRSDLYNYAHAIFSGNPSDRSFFLGETNYQETINQCGKIMACLHGSDAHDFQSIGRPQKNRFTWIKAEPHFQGLRQVLHEPEDRVVIQEHHPDTKSSYNIISSIQFLESNQFTSREIKLNPGLNTVIGGKSSGKSLLLYKIAQAVSKNEIETREMDATNRKELWKNPYSSTSIEEIKFKVNWKNGHVNEYPGSKVIGNITYIPQMYINLLSEDTGNEVLQNKIREIVLKDPTCMEFWQKNSQKESQLKNELTVEISKLFDIMNEEKNLTIEKKRIGIKNIIIEEKEKLEEKLKIKINEANLTLEDEKNLMDYEKNKEEIEKKLKLFLIEKEKDRKLSEELTQITDFFGGNINEIKRKYPIHTDLLDTLHITILNAFIEAQNSISEIGEKRTQEQKREKERLDVVIMLLNPLIEKMKGVLEIQSLKEKIDEQNKYINQLEELSMKIKEVKETISNKKKYILSLFESLFQNKKELKNYFNSLNTFGNISLSTYLDFDQEGFNQNFMKIFNRREKLKNIFSGYELLGVFDDNELFSFSEDDFISKLTYLFDSVLELNESKLKKGFTKQKAVEGLFSISNIKSLFDLEKDGDRLSEMSPGKRGLVLLELFLDLSNEKHPILIDQPEDNLDNRTISKDLVKFIKNKSKERQIIIVTHNANLVVLTDAENVIVANQDKQLVENENSRFEYVNGALECDFQRPNKEDKYKIAEQGIKSHVCEILEGGKKAFELRERKYGF